MYLPQYHRIEENDRWWGDGFTEWTTVKSAEKLFEDHEQPRVPQGGNYYDLLNKETMVWQSELMNKYKIDGMCFYHYYFKDGKKILEKPAENLLKWKDVNMPFCFSWANESWIRSWSKISKAEGNLWTSKSESKSDGNEKNDGVLLEQDYGGVKEWDEHYNYLSVFFKDERYILYNNMPVFIVYKPQNVPCIHDMMERWDYLAKCDGFTGLYTVGTNIHEPSKYNLRGMYIQEPNDTNARFDVTRYKNQEGIMQSLDYKEVWDNLIGKNVPFGASLGGFVGYDDTPRHGRKGCVIRNRNPFIFYEKMKELLVKATNLDSPFVLINAWNEWGEGMYLEPDERFGTGFLEALCQAKKDSICVSIDKHINNEKQIAVLKNENLSLLIQVNKYRDYWRILDKWLVMLEKNESPISLLKKNRYESIGVYGYGMLGRHLVYQLNKENFQIKCIIESQEGTDTGTIPLYTPNDELPLLDIIIVTVLYDYKEIYDKLSKKTNADILPIDKIFD